MTLPTSIKDAKFGTKDGAGVTPRGQLVVGPLAFSKSYFNQIGVEDEVFNFVGPVAGMQFVITGILISADRSVSVANGAIVRIYTADAIDSNVPVESILTTQINRNTSIALPGLNLITDPAVWINADSDDTDIYITILGYYVKEITNG